ncbi:MAG: cation:proton antiporter [Rhodospirillales bacterium]|nr:cation:proton antiporter [Rhodospirillales bacterium]
MHMDPMMPLVVASLVGILVMGFLARVLKQPHVIGYLIAGVALGPFGLSLITDQDVLTRLGALGVVLLLFFVGMEVQPGRLVSGWKVSLLGTLLQVVLSTAAVIALGYWLDWPLSRSVLIGFVISLSSTAVVLKILHDTGRLETDVGQDALGILLMQDLAVIPMLMVIGLMGDAEFHTGAALLQGGGGILMIGLVGWIIVKGTISLPLSRLLTGDHEMEVFAALLLCFGLALLTALFGLSTALGAFAAGMLISAAKETRWVHESLQPFQVVFVALFFVSIGMLVDMEFLWSNWQEVSILVIAVLVTNTVINAVILRLLAYNWRRSLYTGALLSQIGEFSFVLAAVGAQSGLISTYGYQLSITVISLSLVVSPLWIRLAASWFDQSQTGETEAD